MLRLHESLAAVAPVRAVEVGTLGDPSTVAIRFRPEATAAQQAAAQALVTTFDWSAAAHAAWEADRVPERRDLRAAAVQALTDNAAYLALPSPTAAQVRQQTDALTRQVNHLIRRLVQID